MSSLKYKILGYDESSDTSCHSMLLLYQRGIIQHKLEMHVAAIGSLDLEILMLDFSMRLNLAGELFMLGTNGKLFYYHCGKILFKIGCTTNDVL